MNNDNSDDRDNKSSADPAPTGSQRSAATKEPDFSLFDNDTELEVDDIETEDFASDYTVDGYDDDPFDDRAYADDDNQWEREVDRDENDNEYLEEPQKLPVGLIIVALVALALLAAGGYGVIKERAAAEAELTELRARLATAVQQQDLDTERERTRSLESDNARLLSQIDALAANNTTLSEQVSSLQQALERATRPEINTPDISKPSPKPVSQTPTPTKTDAGAGAGGWFVNFGSYSQRAKAQEWASRLKPDIGTVIVVAVESSGGSIFRVRVVGLSSRADAQRIATQLERTYDLTKLWVGEQ